MLIEPDDYWIEILPVVVLCERPKSFKVYLQGDSSKEFWLPKSQMRNYHFEQQDEVGTTELPKWLVAAKEDELGFAITEEEFEVPPRRDEFPPDDDIPF